MARLNAPIMLTSILLSASLWFVLFGQNLSLPATIPVTLDEDRSVGLPTKFHFDKAQAFRLTLQGPTSEITKFQQDADINKHITIDLSTARPGKNTYPLEYDSSINGYVQSPRTVTVSLESINSYSVPVKVEPRGKLTDPNSSLGPCPTSENTVRVTGPSSLVDGVVEVRAILQENQIDTEHPKPVEVALTAYGANGRLISGPTMTIQPERVTISPQIMAAKVDKSVVVSPLIVGTLAQGYMTGSLTLEPSKVRLTGPITTISNTLHVRTEKIDISGLTTSKKGKVRLVVPAGTTPDVNSISYNYSVLRDPSFRKPLPKIPTGTTAQNDNERIVQP